MVRFAGKVLLWSAVISLYILDRMGLQDVINKKVDGIKGKKRRVPRKDERLIH